MQKNENSLNELVTIIKTLRSDKGCPWDRKQTATSLVKYIKEETTELLEAIDANDTDILCEELGDVLYLIVLLAEIHSEQQIFTLKDSVKSISDKLIRRHPHVFGNETVENEQQLKELWEKIKAEEKQNKI